MFPIDDDIHSAKSSWLNDDSKEWDLDRFDFDVPRHNHDHAVDIDSTHSSLGNTVMRTLSISGVAVVLGIVVLLLVCCFCRKRRTRGRVLAPPNATTVTTGPGGVTTVVTVPAASIPYPTQQYYASSPAPVVQPYPAYPAPNYSMPMPHSAPALAGQPNAPAYDAAPPTYEQATDATAKQPPFNPYAPS